jgi:hypothetical protein
MVFNGERAVEARKQREALVQERKDRDLGSSIG